MPHRYSGSLTYSKCAHPSGSTLTAVRTYTWWYSWNPCGPMSRHHWMYFGCQCSSARCNRLLLERLTLLGIFSAEIIALASLSKDSALRLRPFPVELWSPLLSVDLQRA